MRQVTRINRTFILNNNSSTMMHFCSVAQPPRSWTRSTTKAVKSRAFNYRRIHLNKLVPIQSSPSSIRPRRASRLPRISRMDRLPPIHSKTITIRWIMRGIQLLCMALWIQTETLRNLCRQNRTQIYSLIQLEAVMDWNRLRSSSDLKRPKRI